MNIELMAPKRDIVRRAVEADAPHIVALVNSAYRGESSKVGWTTEADILGGQRTDLAQIEDLIRQKNSVILVVTSPDQQSYLACVHLEKVSEKTAYLGMLTVSPTLQTKGLGRSLLNTSEIFARESWRSQEIEMTVISLRVELITWYQRRGYQLSAETRAFPMTDPRFGLPKRKDLEFVILKKSL